MQTLYANSFLLMNLIQSIAATTFIDEELLYMNQRRMCKADCLYGLFFYNSALPGCVNVFLRTRVDNNLF